MKAYIEKGEYAHMELTFLELAEIVSAMSYMCRGPKCASPLAVDMNRRIGQLFTYMLNVEHPPDAPKPPAAAAQPSGKPDTPQPAPGKQASDSPSKQSQLPGMSGK